MVFAGHVEHVADVAAPTVPEYVFVPQSVHAALPLVVLYLPAAHAEQGPRSGPVYPGLQKQVELADGEFVLEGQDEHDPQRDPEYVPAAQE
jgi:hypothetical protein